MVIEKREEQSPIFSEETEAELSDKLKKLLLEVIDKGRINLEHGTDILSEVIARGKPIDTKCRMCVLDCDRCDDYCGGCNTLCSTCTEQQ